MIAREEDVVHRNDRDPERIALLVQELKATLKNSTILTPDSDGYGDSIRRWTDSVEMKAVRNAERTRKCFSSKLT